MLTVTVDTYVALDLCKSRIYISEVITDRMCCFHAEH